MDARILLQAMRTGEHRLVHYVAPDGFDPVVETRGWLFRGESAEPLIVVIGGVHGDEYEGISTCIQLVEALRLKPLGPSVLVVPVANLQAYESQQRFTPVDGVDLNRVFPGNPEGSFSERLAHLIFNSIICKADVVLSLHGWLQTGAVVDYVEIPAPASSVHARCLAIAQGAGFGLIRDTGWLEGRLGSAAVARQIPILESEVGGCGVLDRAKANDYFSYVLRAIAAVSTSDKVPGQSKAGSGARYFRTSAAVRCTVGGFWRRTVDEGQKVVAGAPLGEVVQVADLHGIAVLAPLGGIVGAVRKRAGVAEGDEVAWIFSS